jgi:hypothetical protein
VVAAEWGERMMNRRALLAVGASILAGAGLVASALPAAAMDSGNPYEDMQVGVTYTVYQPSYTAGLATPATATGSGTCPAGTEENLIVAYGPKATPAFVVYQGNPICSDMGDATKVGTARVKGRTATIYAMCPADVSCTRASVKRFGGYLTVRLPAASGLRPTYVELETAGQNAVSAARLIRIARSMQPVQ